MNAIEIRLVKDGDGQTIHIPSALALPGETAVLRREDDRLIIEAKQRRSLKDAIAGLPRPGEDFPDVEELPHTPIDL